MALIKYGARTFVAFIFLVIGWHMANTQVSAQTFGQEFLASEEFAQVDGNGVDVTSGMLNVRTPALSAGENVKFYFSWNGRLWRPNVPALWGSDADNGWIVEYNGESEVFAAPFNPYICSLSLPGYCGGLVSATHYRPNVGSKLVCASYYNFVGIAYCDYESRHGVKIRFQGIRSSFPASARVGDYLSYGNTYSSPISVDDPGYGITKYSPITAGNVSNGGVVSISYPNGYRISTQGKYNSSFVTFTLSNDSIANSVAQTLRILTPNANPSKTNNSYNYPKSVIQTVTDQLGGNWTYQFDSNRNMVRFVDATGVAFNLTYDGSKRVKTFGSAVGTWYYTYQDSTTTYVTDPSGNRKTYKFIKKKGNITEYRDELNRLTKFSYDQYGRITSKTLPEGNGYSYVYDGRGNMTQVMATAKPFTGEAAVVERAEFAATCVSQIICNKPLARIDEQGSRTDFTYDAVFGTTIKQTLPAARPSEPRPEARSQYALRYAWVSDGFGGFRRSDLPLILLVRLSLCRTTASTGSGCVGGAADEIVTDYDYGPDSGPNNLLLRGTAVTSNGETLRTCYQYDGYGRKIAEAQPAANLGVCP